MYEIEKLLFDNLVKGLDRTIVEKIEGLSSEYASKVYIFEDLEGEPKIIDYQELINYKPEKKIKLLVTNIGFHLFSSDDFKSSMENLSLCLDDGAKIYFNALYNEKDRDFHDENESIINAMRSAIEKVGVMELAKHIHTVTRDYQTLPFLGYLFEKAESKLISLDKFIIKTDINKLKDFYKNSYDNNLLNSNQKAEWIKIMHLALDNWKENNKDKEGIWSFMPGLYQNWNRLVFERISDAK